MPEQLISSSSKNEIPWPLVGLWVDAEATVHCAWRKENGSLAVTTEQFRPFVWTLEPTPLAAECIMLGGEGALPCLALFEDVERYKAYLEAVGVHACQVVKPLESQYLMQSQRRLFGDMLFKDIRRLQLDIETASAGGAFSNAKKPNDRVLAIGLSCGDQEPLLLELEDYTDAAERKLLEDLNAAIERLDPDVIEGHNIFNFDLNYLKVRAERLQVRCAWGRFGQEASFRSSRMRIAERWLDFVRCDIPGRTVFDTYLMVQIYDLTARELDSYGLKDVAIALSISDESSRTYVPGHELQKVFEADRERFRAYLRDDLRETEALAMRLLPTYIAQARNFPTTLQEVTLRGTGTKVESVLLEKYLAKRQALPAISTLEAFEGGYTASFQSGVFKNVLHFDFASLYPSILLLLKENPKSDTLGVFMPLLEALWRYRLHYKHLAQAEQDLALRDEYQARQASFKILINSFYGYLGFGGARFADGALAARVTAKARELLMDVIERFKNLGCCILEVDTDGVYLASEVYFKDPQALLMKVTEGLPKGIALEYDGAYEAMFCYKAKNYALYDGQQIAIKGSALRSRGLEKYLKYMNDALIGYLLGVEKENPLDRAESLRAAIRSQTLPVQELAKNEYLSQSPKAYQRALAEGKKSRRASLEVALTLEPLPRMGEKVTYFITPSAKARTPDWQRASAVEHYDATTRPYDGEYYIRKLDEWLERYASFLGPIQSSKSWEQGELFNL